MRDEARELSDLPDVTAIDAHCRDDRPGAVVPALERIWWDDLDDDTFHQILSSWQVAHSIAANYSLRFEDVRAEMNRMSRNLWHLLDTPQGWTVLGEQIALILKGHPNGPLLRPIIH